MRTIITGASSGIGHALAHELARRGHRLALLARRGELLEELARDLRGRGATVATFACDVLDRESVRTAVAATSGTLGGAFDLAIANAGISIPGHATRFKVDDAEQVIRVNFVGMLYLFDAVIPAMVERGSGRFAGIASIAGLRGLPTGAAYSASKAAMQTFLEASRVELAPYGVGVTIVNPGFIDTPLTQKNRFRMPFLMQPAESAAIIADGLERGSRVVEFPRPMSLLMRTVRWLPDAVYEAVTTPYGRRRIDPNRVRR